ncbi:MAG: cobalamin-dependent protein [Acidobacteria bacterium]|nr:cobalamin-dependent protein [Acidobacteriota bacterium]
MSRWTGRRRPVVLYQPRDDGVRMPLGLLAVGSALPQEHVVVVDGRLELAPEARVAELVAEAECLGVTARTGSPLRDAVRVSAAARRANPGLRIVWGGPHASIRPDQCLATGVVDACVVGAGEEAFARCLVAARAGHSFEGLPGVALRAWAPPRPLAPPSPESTPPAQYGLLDLERYFEVRGGRRLDYCSSRGRLGDESHRSWALPPERVVAEVGELTERYRPLTVLFQDGDFFSDTARVEAIARLLVDQRPRVAWEAAARPEELLRTGEEELRLLLESGCGRVHTVLPPGALLLGKGREVVIEAATLLDRVGLAGRFVLEVDRPRRGHDTLNAAVSVARALTRMSTRFETPLERRRVYPPGDDPEGEPVPANLEEWALREETPWPDRRAESRLARRHFFIAEAQRPPGRRPGKRLVHLLARARVRAGFFRLDVERAAVHASALLRTGRPRRPARLR